MTLKSLRFDVLETSLIAALVTVLAVGFVISRRSTDAEVAWLAATYGPSRQSEHYEEWIIRDFFHDQPGGTFVDIGASDPMVMSNTWYLEKKLNWSGVAVDAQSAYEPMYAAARPRTRFRTFFISERSGERVQLFVNDNPLVASSTRSFTQRWGKVQGERIVTTITLTELLEKESVAAVDFLSIDIELAEPKALAGFDLSRFKPRLVCIEAHPEVRQQILDYFSAGAYTVVGKYLRVDADNLWFMPLGTRTKPFPRDVTDKWRTGDRPLW